MKLPILAFTLLAFTLLAAVELRARASTPEPLCCNVSARDAWYGERFARESMEAGALYDLTGGGYYTLLDYTGTYFNHRDGVRLTSDPPSGAPHSLYFFGNSVGYGLTVRDEATIASAVQRRLPGYRVINEATVWGSVHRSLLKVRAVPLRAGDVVVFFGGEDESQGLYYDVVRLEPDRSPCPTLKDVYWGLCREYAYNQQVSLLPAFLAQSSVRLAALRREMLADLTNAAAYVRGHGARFVWVLQPFLWSTALTAGERTMTMNVNVAYADLLARPVEQGIVAQMQAAGVEAYDLTHVLDSARQRGREVYTDHVHLNAAGNALVANAIYDQLSIY